jgi:hypothetical protein
MNPQYAPCKTCGTLVSAEVPKSLCPFCSLPGAVSRPWVTPVSGIATGLFFTAHVAAPTWDHDKGKLTPTDLPYEQKHIEQSNADNASVLSGWGQLSIVAVSTASSTVSNSTSVGFSHWPKV